MSESEIAMTVGQKEDIDASGNEGLAGPAERGGGRIQRKLRRFNRQEDLKILEAYHKSRGERRGFLRSLAEEFGRPFASVEKRYYYLMAKGKDNRSEISMESLTVSRTRSVATSSTTEEELTTEWLSLPERVRDIEERLAGMIDFKEFLARLTEMHDSFEREQALLAEIAEKDKEIARMKQEFSRAIDRIQQREGELDEIRSILENTLAQWMKLSAVDKFKVLGDFATKLENTVEKLGSVVRRRPVWVSREF